MERYDSYKDSGVEWIGKIPSHWNFGDMRYQLSNNDGGVWGKDIEGDNEGTIVIRSTEITIDGKWDLSDPMRRLLSNSEIEKTLLFEGDIVLTKSSGSPDHIGKSVIVNTKVENLKCCYSNFVQRIRFKESNPKLYHYILNNYIVREQYRYLTQSSTGLGNLNGTTLNEVKLPFIPLSEQQQIVSFLDTKTSLIDSLIEKTQRKIELLKEKRTSLINEVVTKGLNPNVEMKDSGVEWIGEIPSHWGRKKLGYLVNLQGRIGFKGYKKTDFVDEGEGCLVIGGKHIDKNNRINLSDPDYLNWEKYYESPEIMVFKGDLIVSQRGTLGKVLFIEEDYGPLTINPSLVVVNQIKENPKFLWYFLQSDSIMKTIDVLGSVTTIPMLSQEEISNFPITVPPIPEQQQIVEYLDEQTQKIDKTISIEEKRIELLKEYRQSLISEVVTGKLKVVV